MVISDGVRASLDWLSVTYFWDGCTSALSALPSHPLLTVQPGAKRERAKHYDLAVRLKAGRVAWHSQREDMGIQLVLTGDDLRAVRGTGTYPDELTMLNNLVGDGRASRLDFALDYVGDKTATATSIRAAWAAGGIDARAKRFTYYEGLLPAGSDPVEKPETFYVGSRQSPQYFRAYNKAAEMGGLWDAWLRVELQSNGKHAAFVGALAKQTQMDFLALTRSMIDQYITIDVPWWVQIVRDAQPMERYKDTQQTDTQRWLIEKIMPIIEREISNGSRAVMDAALGAIWRGEQTLKERELHYAAGLT
jgi:DNA relaxase NicK